MPIAAIVEVYMAQAGSHATRYNTYITLAKLARLKTKQCNMSCHTSNAEHKALQGTLAMLQQIFFKSFGQSLGLPWQKQPGEVFIAIFVIIAGLKLAKSYRASCRQ
jgi:hypothetical protein